MVASGTCEMAQRELTVSCLHLVAGPTSSSLVLLLMNDVSAIPINSPTTTCANSVVPHGPE